MVLMEKDAEVRIEIFDKHRPFRIKAWLPGKRQKALGRHKFPRKMQAEVGPTNSRKLSLIKIDLYGYGVRKVSSQLAPIKEAIEKSRYILDLKANWDDEGSPAYSESAWYSAVNFLLNFSEWTLESVWKAMPPPKIYHAPDTSIDIYWKNTNYSLLINVAGDKATFSGEKKEGTEIQGFFYSAKYKQSFIQSFLLNP